MLRHVIGRNKAWLQRKVREQREPSRLISAVITDINGTVDTAVFGSPLDLDHIIKIRDLIALVGKDPAIPRLCFNTGWDVNYTLLYAQMLGAPAHHVIERGAAVVSLDGPFIRETMDPRITAAMIREIAQVQMAFIAEHPRHYENLQLGKKYSMSFQFEMGSKEKERCLSDVKSFIASRGMELDIEEGPNFFNVGFPDIDKGTGATMLVAMLEGVDFSSTCGIGDSDGDWTYMSKCGFTACPSNASRFLRERCDYVATKPETEGTLEILERIVQWNITMIGGS